MSRMKRWAHALALLTAVSSAACASASRAVYETQLSAYRAITDQRSHASIAVARVFDAKRLSRRGLIAAVLERNPSLESARQAWRAALAHYRQAGAYEDPRFMASLAPLSIVSPHIPFGYDVEISQHLPLGGKLEARAAIAAAEAASAGSHYAEARLELALAASELYDDYAFALRALEIQAQHLKLMAALKDNVTSAYVTTSTSVQDALQADAELARLEYQRTVYETERDVAVAQLNALLHREPSAALPSPEVESDASTKRMPSAHAELAQRPDVAAARAKVQVARARVDAAEREFYPDLTVSTSYNSMWGMPEHRWMAGVAINVPLQRERRKSQVDEASAMRAMSENEVNGVLDTARSEVAVAARRLQQAQRAVQLYEQRLVPVARARIEAARSGFIASQNNFMSVIEAERGLRSAELELEMARAELGKRGAALERVLGRLPVTADNERAEP